MARGTFGERLKRERELREVSMDELTKATRISTRFVEALENEDWTRLPGGIFGRGFVRTIARYLGLNEEALLGEYDMARADHPPEAPAKHEDRIPAPPKWLPVLAVCIVLLLVAGLFYAGRYGWRRYAAHRAAKKVAVISLAAPPAPQPGSTSPELAGQSSNAASSVTSNVASSVASSETSSVASNVASSAASSTARLELSVSTSAATRVRILADNRLLLDRKLPAGETRHFSAKQQFEVTAGNSAAVLLQLNGKAMPPLGAPGVSGTMVLSHKNLRL